MGSRDLRCAWKDVGHFIGSFFGACSAWLWMRELKWKLCYVMRFQPTRPVGSDIDCHFR